MPRAGQRPPFRRLAGAWVGLLAGLLATLPAVAQPISPEQQRAAAEAYDRATRAFLSRDYPHAAEWFETADRMAPSQQALIAAIRAHRRVATAEHLARAATLALQLRSRPGANARTAALAERTLGELSPRLGRVLVDCGSCSLSVDDVAQSAQDFFLPPGRHALAAGWSDGRSREVSVEIAAGGRQAVHLEEPPPAERPAPTVFTRAPLPPPPARGARRLSPAWFFVGLGATAVLGALASWSWIDTLDGARQFDADLAAHRATQAQLDDGIAREQRTTALVISTAAVGAIALITGIFFTRWRAPVEVRPAALPALGGSAPGVVLAGAL